MVGHLSDAGAENTAVGKRHVATVAALVLYGQPRGGHHDEAEADKTQAEQNWVDQLLLAVCAAAGPLDNRA